MSLNESLDALRAKMTSEAAGAYEEVLQRLDPRLLAENALKPGDVMPNFELPNAEGKMVSSLELLEPRNTRRNLLSW